MVTAELPVVGSASDQPFVAAIAHVVDPEGDDMSKKKVRSADSVDSSDADADDSADIFDQPAGTGAAAEILEGIEPPEFMKLRPGQRRPLGRNASIPAEFIPWVEEVQEAFGLTSFSDAALYLLCVAAKIPFQSVSSRRGFGAATKKALREAIKLRQESVREKMRNGTWVGRGPLKKPEGE